MRVWSGLLAAAGLAALTGCKVFERWGLGRDRPASGEPASRTKDGDPFRPPPNWLDNPALPGGKAATVPPAGSYGDPRDPNYDLRNEVKGLLAGVVVDPDGRGVPYLDIQIDVTDAPAGGAPVTAQTDRNGYFLIRGLKPNQSYTLTAQAKQGGRAIAGQSVARTPSPYVRIQLRDDVALPPAKGGPDLPPPAVGGAPSGSPAPPAANIPGGPPALFDGPGARGPGGAGGPVPLSRDTGALPYPAENPTPDGAYSPVPPARPPGIASPRPPASPRPDLVAPGPHPDKPPPANIPGPGAVLPPPPLPPPSTSRSAPKAAGAFSLVDPLGRPRAFPSGRAGELVLLDFMTTTCGPCAKAVPALTALQSKYGARGFEVVAVACDDADEAGRRQAAGRYADGHRLNYLVYTEPGSAPGAVMKPFAVTEFPTLVLVDGSGSVVWRGRPADLDALERAIQQNAGR
jgi:thiol-disulfide isomerase/thioredoxin